MSGTVRRSPDRGHLHRLVRAGACLAGLALAAGCAIPGDPAGPPTSGPPGAGPSLAVPSPTSPSPPRPSPTEPSPVDTGPRASPLPGWMDAPSPPPGCPRRPTVRVATSEELQDALDDAGPGTVIGLEDGVYEGRFAITTSGDDDDPAWLCGSGATVLDAGSTGKGYALHLDDAGHWVVQGLIVRNAQKGVMVDGGDDVVLRGLTVHTIGDEAVHLRRGTTDSIVEGNVISDTGLREPRFGEGVYIGSAHSNWCDLTDCEPDRSDRNTVRGNVVHHVTAEAVDIKEGTTGGRVLGNLFDGASSTAVDSWVAVKGNGWTIADNEGRRSPEDGIQVYVVRDGWGEGNVVTGNRGRIDQGQLVRDDAPGTRADCSNEVTGDGRLGLDC